MKINFLLVLSSLLLILTKGNSQNLYLDIGLNFSKVVDSNNLEKEQFQRNPVIGIGFSDKIHKRIGFNLESQYSIKGYRIKGAYSESLGFLPKGFTNFNYHYIDILPTLYTDVYKGLKLVAGFDIGWKIGETYNGEKAKYPTHKSFDYGVLTGIQYNLDRYFLRVLANQGLINPTENLILTDDKGNLIGPISYKNYNIQATIGFQIFEFDHKINQHSESLLN